MAKLIHSAFEVPKRECKSLLADAHRIRHVPVLPEPVAVGVHLNSIKPRSREQSRWLATRRNQRGELDFCCHYSRDLRRRSLTPNSVLRWWRRAHEGLPAWAVPADERQDTQQVSHPAWTTADGMLLAGSVRVSVTQRFKMIAFAYIGQPYMSQGRNGSIGHVARKASRHRGPVAIRVPPAGLSNSHRVSTFAASCDSCNGIAH